MNSWLTMLKKLFVSKNYLNWAICMLKCQKKLKFSKIINFDGMVVRLEKCFLIEKWNNLSFFDDNR